MRSSSQRIRHHLGIAFPEADQREIRRLAAGCARHFGLMLAEVAWLHRAGTPEVERLCRISGLEHLESALGTGRGAMLATAHCGNWELLNARLPVAEIPLTIAVRRLDDPRLDRMVAALRCRFGTEVVPRGETAGRVLARALAANRVDGLLIDQDIRDVPGVFVPFFGRPAWTPSGAAVLAIRLRAPVLPGFIHRLPDGTHEATIHPPLPIPTGGSLEERVKELTAAATAAIEAQIRAYPEQWVWMHRRWRTRPQEETRPDLQ
jgi:KDO2-lipid IV(A) lauroyltransferase